MSKVLTGAKNRYKRAMIIESVCLVVFGLLVALWQGESAVDFSLGLSVLLFHFVLLLILFFFANKIFQQN